MTHAQPGAAQFFWLLLISFAVSLLARRVRVPYALALVITGLGIGATRLLPQARLDPSLLFTVFLPPLLFESAIHIRLDALRRDWKPITLYTMGGVLLSTALVAWLGNGLLGLPLASALVLGALISATDPISVLAIFKRLGAGKRLTLIVEAESLFNDGVAVVLFSVFLGLAAGAQVSIASGLLQFVQLVAGGTLLGIAVGWLSSRLHTELDDHLIEITLTSMVAFGSYALAEALHVSGVMAVVAAGLFVGNHGMPQTMSPGTRLAVVAFWEYASFVVNSVLFLLIGIEVTRLRWSFSLAILAVGAVVVVLIGRSAIYPLSLLINATTRRKIPLAWQHVLFWGSLRGALSMALALGLPADFPARTPIVAATFGVVFFSLLAQGLSIGPLLKYLGLSHAPPQIGDASPEQRLLAAEIVACRAALLELEARRGDEAYPNWSIELLLRDYRARIKLLEDTMGALHPEHASLAEREAIRSRQAALLAEKDAWHDSQRRGWLSDDDWKRIASRLDEELIALEKRAG